MTCESVFNVIAGRRYDGDIRTDSHGRFRERNPELEARVQRERTINGYCVLTLGAVLCAIANISNGHPLLIVASCVLVVLVLALFARYIRATRRQ